VVSAAAAASAAAGGAAALASACALAAGAAGARAGGWGGWRPRWGGFSPRVRLGLGHGRWWRGGRGWGGFGGRFGLYWSPWSYLFAPRYRGFYPYGWRFASGLGYYNPLYVDTYGAPIYLQDYKLQYTLAQMQASGRDPNAYMGSAQGAAPALAPQDVEALRAAATEARAFQSREEIDAALAEQQQQ